jgi:hypothetical protein
MKTLLACSMLVLAAACVRVQGDLPPICTTVSLEFAGARIGAVAAKPMHAEQTFPFGSGLNSFSFSRLQSDGGSVTPGNGTADLSFLDSLALSIAAPAGSSLSEVQLVAWRRPSGGTAARIDVPAQQDNLVPYFGAAGLSLRVSLTGTPPPAGFSLLVDLCASASVDQTLHI